MVQKIQEYAKFVAALLGFVVTTGTTLIPVDWSPWLTFAAGLATAVAVAKIPNAPKAGK